jgi:hypothetical protein
MMTSPRLRKSDVAASVVDTLLENRAVIRGEIGPEYDIGPRASRNCTDELYGRSGGAEKERRLSAFLKARS